MSHYANDVEKALELNLSRLWQRLALGEEDQEIVCQLLLGSSRQEIAFHQVARQRYGGDEAKLRSHQKSQTAAQGHLKKANQRIGDRLSSRIYPAFAELMDRSKTEIAGNWVKILNFLLDPQQGFRISLPPQLNSDNFQGSMGRQIFLSPPDQAIAQTHRDATQFYQRGLYYQAFNTFLSAWQQEKTTYGYGNPEILIYLNNALVSLYQETFESRQIAVVLVAVVVPFHHNQGQVAAEVLRGAAQMQWQLNRACLKATKLDSQLDEVNLPPCSLESTALAQVALKIIVVNDPNHVYNANNPTAERLAQLAPELNIMAVVGHYSSEMTEKALPFYAMQGLPLINGSSTSETLSALPVGLRQSLFRLTTPDKENATALMRYLTRHHTTRLPQQQKNFPQRIAIVYNRNSQYCLSYRSVVQAYVAAHPEKFELLPEWARLSDSPPVIQQYLKNGEAQDIDILLVILDGGIEPNSLINAGLNSRVNLSRCMIAGSATLQQENFLYWMHERHLNGMGDAAGSNIVACVPWHSSSAQHGRHAGGRGAQFCQLGEQLWGSVPLTWRSATAYDALLIIETAIVKGQCRDRTALLQQLDTLFRVSGGSIVGVTGQLRFGKGCDRIDPPTEIITIKADSAQQTWHWQVVTPDKRSTRRVSKN